VSSDAETVWLRLAKDGGQTSAFAAHGGSYLKLGNRELFRSSSHIHLAVQALGSEIRIQVAGVRGGGCALDLGMGPVKSATFEGKAIAAEPAGEERFRLALPGDGTLVIRLGT
jgi:hypothetical protein